MRLSYKFALSFALFLSLGHSFTLTQLLYQGYNQASSHTLSKLHLDESRRTTAIVFNESPEMYPMELGKALFSLAEGAWNNQTFGTDLILDFSQNENMEFFVFMLWYPSPMEPPQKTFFKALPLVTLTLNFAANANLYSLFQLFSTQTSDLHGNSIFGLGGNLDHIQIPLFGYYYIQKRMNDAEDSVDIMGLSIEDSDFFVDKIMEMRVGMTQEITYMHDSSQQYNEVQILQTWGGNFEPVDLQSNEVLYARTDESAHIWTNADKTEVYVVDIGATPMFNGLQAVIKNTQTFQKMFIYLTHYHIDHCQSLAAFINRTDVPEITLVVQDSGAFQFVGWYLENFDHLIAKVEAGILKFDFIRYGYYENFGELQIQGIMTHTFEEDDLTHYVTNGSPAFIDKDGKVKIFSGDISFPRMKSEITEEYFKDTVYAWVNDVLFRAAVPEDSDITFFLSLGHFFVRVAMYDWQIGDPQYMTIDEFFDFIYASFPQYPNLKLVEMHVKDNAGFSLDLYQPAAPTVLFLESTATLIGDNLPPEVMITITVVILLFAFGVLSLRKRSKRIYRNPAFEEPLLQNL